jgi:xanthine dehydrogenase molybdopterin-binding subunit B
MIGKRPPWHVKYEIGFDDDGKLEGIKYDWYSDPGFSPNGSLMFVLYNFFDSVYKCPNYYIKPNLVKSNKPASTEVRSPDLLAIVNLTEQVMDHVASYLKKDPLSVRQVNFFKKGDKAANGHELPYIDIDGVVNKLVNTSEYNKRKEEIESFNKTSLFKKRGISLIPLRYAMTYNLGYYNALVAVRHHDGSVAVSHGGVEMGQGIHTKVAQVNTTFFFFFIIS